MIYCCTISFMMASMSLCCLLQTVVLVICHMHLIDAAHSQQIRKVAHSRFLERALFDTTTGSCAEDSS